LRNHKTILSIAAWCLYDWASSSFAIIVTTFVFATYFTTKVASDHIIGTYQWANAIALAGAVIALISPVLGAIADHAGHHKRWLFFFSWICIASTALLWFSYPNPNSVYFTLTFVILGTIGSEVALVFYNTFLTYLAPKNYIGRISGWGWGCGYLGGIFALLITLMIFIKNNVFSLDTSTAAQIRICGPFVALWYALFSLPLFFLVPGISSTSRPLMQAVRAGCLELLSILRKIPQEKNVFLYLLAHMVYADGLNTLFAFGGIYAAGTYGLSFEEVLIFGITMNITAGIGAILFAWVDDYFSSKNTVIISLICLIIFGLPILFLHDKYIFWSVALLLCVFVGPVQSASRSLMVHLIAKKEISTEWFGLFSLSGRISAFMGPWLLGLATMLFDSQRVGMATIIVFFILGMLLLLPVRVFDKDQATVLV